ncbi:hypothetical protein D3C72_1532790 [compost metagenome]
MDLQAGIFGQELRDARRDQLHREERPDLDPEDLPGVARADMLDDAFEIVEGAIARSKEQGAFGRQLDAVLFPDEDAEAEIVFKDPDLVTDGALADAQLVCRRRQAAIARRRLEGAQGFQARQIAHGLLRKVVHFLKHI